MFHGALLPAKRLHPAVNLQPFPIPHISELSEFLLFGIQHLQHFCGKLFIPLRALGCVKSLRLHT